MVRILHTADWHLGKIVNGVHMTDDQSYVIEQFFQIIEDYKPDLIINAGDIYDRAIPPKEAVDLLDQTLTRLMTDFKIPTLMISGNHDSPDRLHFGSQLFRDHQLYIQSKFVLPIEPITIYDRFGPVHFYLIPYFEPADVQKYYPDEEITTHQIAMESVIQSIKESLNPNERHVCVAHAFLAGGMSSDSEDRLSMIGGSPYIEVSLFKDFNYVALGHLHQPQKISSDHIQYSGSLLKYSFSEANQTKSMTIIELDDQGEISLERIPLKPKHDLRVLTDYFDQLLNGPEYEASEDYLHIQLLDDGQILDPITQLRKKFPNILRLEKITKQSARGLNELERMKQRQKRSELELFEDFYFELTDQRLTEKRKQMLQSVINQINQKEREQ
ncbi:exonuclease SbcCD subunit D [Amphibacillus xylanus]|uniref:Nuclease SbcCD subunit D n=1 Tax=Amphibacillus xylanus (strain ATCC 51415 / DSM 6626 / JCM 7361 / LMG 17667 / NBRC 15112 / Ep01) TaxID=698758 RepID=K0J2P9_AMPXN|nr:exonuclease SbcCD subunit D [Amphibacillus xylanus]BAM47417.1 putative exonuclease [Amphibacillus xylanus NBRC 15112]